MFKKIFLYSNLYIAFGAVAACYATTKILNFVLPLILYEFIFFATLSSYCFHWWLTPNTNQWKQREIWSIKNKALLLSICIISCFVGTYFFWLLPTTFYWYIIPLIIFTFLYSAPKISFAPFISLRKFIYAKTFYLTLAWTYATVVMPILSSAQTFTNTHYQYIVHRFAIIFIICAFFDYKDKVEDMQVGIKTIISFFSNKLIILFIQLFLSISIIAIINLYNTILPLHFVLNFLPIIAILFCYKKTIDTSNELWFYFILDGIMFINGFIYLGIFCSKYVL